MNWECIKTKLEVIETIITILGVPGAIFVFIRESRRYQDEKAKSRRDREQEVYDKLDDKYIDFITLCANNPELGIKPDAGSSKGLKPEQEYKKLKLFEILISIFERAFLMYNDPETSINENEWQGWDDYIQDWTKNEDFKKVWATEGNQWAKSFIGYMKKKSI